MVSTATCDGMMMMRRKGFLICLSLIGGAARIHAQTGPDQAELDEVVRLGTMAALAPLCGVREEAWAFDLRRAAIFEATHIERPDDPALKSAPASHLVVSALSFAETEALENFAAAAPAETCLKLVSDPGLTHADDVVQRFRKLKFSRKPFS